MNDYEPHLGLYDMRKDTTGLPEGLANKINSSICMKGGGGGGTIEKSLLCDFVFFTLNYNFFLKY